MLPEKTWELMARKLSGEASAADEQELQALMDAHPELLETMHAAESLHTDTAVENMLTGMTSDGWQQIAPALSAVPDKKPSNILRLLIRTGWAAAIVVTGLLSYYWWQQQHAWATIATTGAKDSLLLPDGSKIFLNAQTTLRYARSYGKGSREVVLDKGEAYFEVAQLENNPFTVHAASVDIRVLGTAFNVHRSANGQVDIFVNSGSIKAENKAGRNVVLHAGAQVAASEKTPEIKPVYTPKENVLAWKTNKLVFNQMPLSEVAVVLANYYQLDVVITDSTVSGKVLQATFNNKSLDEVTDIIGKVLNVNIKQKGKTLEFHQ